MGEGAFGILGMISVGAVDNDPTKRGKLGCRRGK